MGYTDGDMNAQGSENLVDTADGDRQRSPEQLAHELQDAHARADEVVARIERIHPSDQARVLEEFSPVEAAHVLRLMKPARAADVLEQMGHEEGAEVITELPRRAAADVLEQMAPDDAADLLEQLDEGKRTSLVEQMHAPEAAEVRQLLRYPPHTAGGIMTTEVCKLPREMTVAQAIEELRKHHEQVETIYYVFVVGEDDELLGVLSLREILLARPEQKLGDIMNRDVKSVPVLLDREDVARLMSKYDFNAMPVVDLDNRLIGLVTIDDVVDVIADEATEDAQKMVGAGADEKIDSALWTAFRKRVPWLLVNLGMAMIAASMVGLNQGLIQSLPLLAVFLPVIANQGGNAGSQTLAVTIRGIALGQIRGVRLGRLFAKQFMLGLLNGVVVGAVAFGIGFVWTVYTTQSARPVMMGLVIAMAMTATLVMASVAGTAIPLLLRALRLDPAQASSIFLLTLTDLAGFTVFLTLAKLFEGTLLR